MGAHRRSSCVAALLVAALATQSPTAIQAQTRPTLEHMKLALYQ